MLYPILKRDVLLDLYERKSMSMMEISKHLGCSHHKVAYWMGEYKIKRRTIGDAVYLRSNPNGDPFNIKTPKTAEELVLFGLGVGLYWGEGNKAHQNAVRLGNSDPELLKLYILFLTKLCRVKKEALKFDLQIFSDINVDSALNYWTRELNVKSEQFFKPRVTISGSIGTYKKKSKYGVVTIYFGNTKLRNIVVEQISDVVKWLMP